MSTLTRVPDSILVRAREAHAREIAARNARMAKLYQGGETLREVGARYGITRERARQILDAAGVQRREPGGFARPPSYSRAQCRAAVRLYRDGAPIASVAAALGISSPEGARKAMLREGEATRARPRGKCGSLAAYRGGCHCAPCRRANADYFAVRRRDRRARGLCIACPEKRVNATYCEACRVKVNDRLRVHHARRRAASYRALEARAS